MMERSICCQNTLFRVVKNIENKQMYAQTMAPTSNTEKLLLRGIYNENVPIEQIITKRK